jgi:hypothetical protein
VNTHRLLVTGIRVPTKQPVASVFTEPGAAGPGFPWWILVIVGAILLGIFITRPLIPGRARGKSAVRGDGPWIDVVSRPSGSHELAEWVALRRSVLGDDDSDDGSADSSASPGYGYTWALKDSDGLSLCISTRVFGTVQEAQDDAAHWAESLRDGLHPAIHTTETGGRKHQSFWWTSAHGDEPQFMSVSTIDSSTVHDRAQRAFDMLKTAVATGE